MLDLVGHLGHVPASTPGQHTEYVVLFAAVCLFTSAALARPALGEQADSSRRWARPV